MGQGGDSGDSRRSEAVQRPDRGLHGRDVELAATRRFLARVELGPAALVLSGTAGMGKTSLWSDAVGMARAAGMRVLRTRPSEADAGVAFAGLRDLIGEAAPGG